MSTTTDESGFMPPYASFETFKQQFVRLRDRPVPPRLDRSLFLGMAGGTQTQVLAAMRAFRLIGAEGEVTQEFVLMTKSEDALIDGMASLLRRFYLDQLALAEQRATAAQLEESFRSNGYTGSTLRKAVTFFLNMANFAGVEVSPYFRTPPQRVIGKRRAGTRSVAAASTPSSDQKSGNAGVDSHTVALRSGGEVVLSCSVNLFRLDASDRQFVFDLIDRLRSYEDSLPGHEPFQPETTEPGEV